MKKIFPVIVVLISLSLLGIIWIQLNWFGTMLTERREQLELNVTKALINLSSEITDNGGLSSLKTIPKTSLAFEENPMVLKLQKPPSVAERYTAADVADLLNKALKAENVKNLKYEFGIQDMRMLDFEMESRGFAKELLDTVNNKRLILTLEPPQGSIFESFGAFENFILVMPDFEKQVLRSVIWMILASALFSIIILSAFVLTVRTMLRQKKLSEIKGDFINNMTHEFKTPIATISLAVDALKNEKVLANPEKMQYFTGIIKQENKRMNQHVETILKAALQEKQDLEMNRAPIHAHGLIENVLAKFELQLSEKNGGVEMNLNATNDLIAADEQHFSNLLNNLIDNAVKYCKENVPPVIKVSTSITKTQFQIKIEDNGIGMSRDTVKRVFERFYRAHTGNVHNVKGFGLGLSYVKTVIDAHEGKIKVESTMGKGSTFTVELPLIAS
jgi:two-component system, OmpR family, phosphate regulon sensor histidine kinase PhoR